MTRQNHTLPHTWIHRLAQASPDRVALIDAYDKAWTWSALHALVVRVHAKLVDVPCGGVLCVDVPAGAHFIALYSASLWRGCVPLLMHARWSEHERRHIRELMAPAATVTLDEQALHVRCEPGASAFPWQGGAPLYVLCTSGSTGLPKAVGISAQMFDATLRQFACALELAPDDVYLACAPWFHVAGLHTMLLPTLRLGGTIVCTAGFEPERIAELVRRHKVTATFMVPTMWHACRQSRGFDLGHFDGLRVALTGGARTPVSLLSAWAERGVELVIGYGMTEAAPMVTLGRASHWRADALSVGPPHTEVQLKLTEGTSRVAIKAPNVMSGYVTRSGSLDRSDFDDDGFFVSQDVGALTATGELLFLGRADRVIVSGGEKISGVEVEAAIERIPGVAQVVVVGLPSDYWGEIVAAAVTLTSERESLELDELRRLLNGKMARYKMPRGLDVRAQMPVGTTGKIDVERVRAQMLASWQERT